MLPLWINSLISLTLRDFCLNKLITYFYFLLNSEYVQKLWPTSNNPLNNKGTIITWLAARWWELLSTQFQFKFDAFSYFQDLQGSTWLQHPRTKSVQSGYEIAWSSGYLSSCMVLQTHTAFLIWNGCSTRLLSSLTTLLVYGKVVISFMASNITIVSFYVVNEWCSKGSKHWVSSSCYIKVVVPAEVSILVRIRWKLRFLFHHQCLRIGFLWKRKFCWSHPFVLHWLGKCLDSIYKLDNPTPLQDLLRG